MPKVTAIAACVALTWILAGCGDDGESKQLRAELSALRTQVAQPTATPTEPPTATAVPTPAGTPTRTIDEEKQLIAEFEVEKIRALVRGAQDQAWALQSANPYNSREYTVDLLDEICVDVPENGYSGSIRVGGYEYSVGALWPVPYLDLDSAVLSLCEGYKDVAYSKLGGLNHDYVIGFAQDRRTELLNLLESLPDYSDSELKRVLVDRQ